MAKSKRAAAKAPAAKTGTADEARSRAGSKPARKSTAATQSRAESAAAATPSGAAAPTTGKSAVPKPASKRKASAKLTPFDPEYERPISELPPLVFPNSEQYEFRVKAEERRRIRLRNEAVFAAVLVAVGLVVLVVARTPGMLGLAAIAAIAMAAYELMVSGLE